MGNQNTNKQIHESKLYYRVGRKKYGFMGIQKASDTTETSTLHSCRHRRQKND